MRIERNQQDHHKELYRASYRGTERLENHELISGRMAEGGRCVPVEGFRILQIPSAQPSLQTAGHADPGTGIGSGGQTEIAGLACYSKARSFAHVYSDTYSLHPSVLM
jgi:hypothetical protein